MTEAVFSFISNYGALPFAGALFFYTFKHTEFPLKSACGFSASMYIFCFWASGKLAGNPIYFEVFALIDLIWLLVLWRICQVSKLIVVAFGLNFLLLSVANTLLHKHWLFHGYYDYLYVPLSLLFLASLTVLPQKYPVLFQSPYDERDDDRGSFVAFIAGVTSKDFRNFLSSRGI